MKKLYMFDLDGTLTDSKSSVDRKTVDLLTALRGDYENYVAVISGCSMGQFNNQFIPNLNPFFDLQPGMLFLLPTSGAYGYVFAGHDVGWSRIWGRDLVLREKAKIYNAFVESIDIYNKQILDKQGFGDTIDVITREFGDIAEDRGSQVTFSMLGQKAPLYIKKMWDPDVAKRKKIISIMHNILPKFEIRIGGTTSIDVTKKGIDKSFGVLKIIEHLKINKDDITFVGDGLFDGGNDYVVKSMGVECIPTTGVEKTKEIIEQLIKRK